MASCIIAKKKNTEASNNNTITGTLLYVHRDQMICMNQM